MTSSRRCLPGHPGAELLRDVRREVFDEWYERRSEGDLVIKMNTGNGKTLVGTADQHQ